MHRCLLSDDILSRIIDFIVPLTSSLNPRTSGYRDGHLQGTLSSLARTCRTLSEPSLRRLWREMLSLTPLFALISYGSQAATQSLQECLPSSEQQYWARLRYYACHIHCLTISDREEDWHISTDALAILAASSSPLLPHLQSLDWSCRDLAQHIHFLLSSSVTKLALSIEHLLPSGVSTSPDAHNAFSLIVQQCPLVTELTIRTDLSSPLNLDIPNHPSQFSELLALRSLTLCPRIASFVTLSQIGILPRLQQLAIDLTSCSFQPEFLERLLFHRVEQLEVACRSNTTILIAFLDAFQPINVTHLTIRCDSGGDSSEIARLHECLSRFTSLTRLLYIDTCIPINPIASSVFSPLSSLQSLVELWIVNDNLRGDDSLITFVAMAFPSLQRLYLHWHESTNSPQVTLMGLQPLAMRCTSLRSLTLPSVLTDATFNGVPAHGRLRQSACALSQLHIGRARAADPEYITSILSNYFPRLRVIHTSGGAGYGVRSDDDYSGWEKVERLLRSHSEVGSMSSSKVEPNSK
ncbi:hypothetical protein HGRIS_004204 [Hohenbuehelia grisea]|uniref:F-box domain-containing protein n=1 Tax=Hohenbuehelia grisea TaxID=104357 RepID=A0ABR3JIM4_9AGAR